MTRIPASHRCRSCGQAGSLPAPESLEERERIAELTDQVHALQQTVAQLRGSGAGRAFAPSGRRALRPG